jgi:hypothetical protein
VPLQAQGDNLIVVVIVIVIVIVTYEGFVAVPTKG